MIISISMFFISFFSFVVFIIMLILSRYDAGFIISMFSSMLTFLIGSIMFYKITNKYPLNDLSEYYFKDFKKLLIKSDNYYLIRFIKKDGVWYCKNNSFLLKLDLKGYLFQKSYLISFVIRNLRYPIISNNLPFKYLFSNNCFIKDGFNVKIEIIQRKKVEKMIVKNGISRYGFVARKITFSPFYLSSISNRNYHSILRTKSYIDEKRYKSFFIKNRK